MEMVQLGSPKKFARASYVFADPRLRARAGPANRRRSRLPGKPSGKCTSATRERAKAKVSSGHKNVEASKMDRRTLRGPLYAGEAFSAQAAGPARPNLPDSKGLRHVRPHDRGGCGL